MTFRFSGYDKLALDTETTGLRYKVDEVFGFSVTVEDRSIWCDLRKNPKYLQWLKDELDGYQGLIIFHNASFDIRMLDHVGVPINLAQADDTVIRASCINEHEPTYTLDFLGKKYLHRGKVEADRTKLHELSDDDIEKYAVGDSELTYALWEWQEREIRQQGIEAVVSFERSIMPTFIRSEMRGIRVDLDYAHEAADALTPHIDELQDSLGADLNVNSPPQVKKLFNPREVADGVWVTDAGEPLGTTPKGAASLKAEYLRELSDPRAKSIIELRSLLKTRDTFLRQHVIEHAVGDRVYPNINQTKNETHGTGTGRLSMSNPAMQQIPSRNKEIAAIVKPCFLPDEGHVWVAADMASFEVRVFAHLVNNPEIIQAYIDDPTLDLHKFVAELTNLVRNATYSGEPNAKQLNLSMIFNSGNGAIAHKMGMDYEWTSFTTAKGEVVTYRKAGPEAMAVIDKYHRRLPGIKELAEEAKKLAERSGYLFTYTGRRLRFPRKFKTYKASGILIQATSADLNKENWKYTEEELDGVGHMIVNTHDDYNLSLPEDNWEEPFKRVQRRIEAKDRIRVPLLLEHSGTGANWWQAIKKS